MKLLKPVTLSLAAAVSLALAGNALADDHHHEVHAPAPHVVRHVDVRGATWGHGDINHFHEVDVHTWNGGHWAHDWHNNHYGWWWVVGGAWVFFNAPVYPYPDPYVPPTVVVQQAPAPAVVVAPPPTYWYYCASAQNYYPYVANCPMGWEQVPATAPAETPTAPPAPPQDPNAPPPPPPPGG